MQWRHHCSLCSPLLASAVMLAAAPDVTPERLANPEPGNWLMNHRTYDAQRYSPLDKRRRSGT
jgi:alcohol dehydrogenase (cytochrome c)